MVAMVLPSLASATTVTTRTTNKCVLLSMLAPPTTVVAVSTPLAPLPLALGMLPAPALVNTRVMVGIAPCLLRATTMATLATTVATMEAPTLQAGTALMFPLPSGTGVILAQPASL